MHKLITAKSSRFASPDSQRGVGFFSLILYFVVGGVLVLLVLKLFPVYIDYFAIKKVIAAMATSEEIRTGTVGEIRSSFDRRAVIDNITSIKSTDLDISKENGDAVVSATWQQAVPLFTGYTLMIDFSVSTANAK